MEQTTDRQLTQPEENADEPEKLTRKARRLRWKAAKKARREERRKARREYYRYAPWAVRAWHLHLKKPFAVILGLAILFLALAEPVQKSIISPLVMEFYFSMKDEPLSEEDIPRLYELSPLDEEGAKRIDAYPPVGADETWTICVYIVGSNLEDMNENDLSVVSAALTQEARAANAAALREDRIARLSRFNDELKENGLELPAFFYYPTKPVASSKAVTQDVIVASRPGAASVDIGEMSSETWSDNIQLVIQTGGATRWSNQLVNPNRTQRFHYKSGVFSEVANLPLEPPSEPETLSDFLRFCKTEYPADHTMLVLWNHGGGPFGYGNDSIYAGDLSLSDLREALSAVYTPNRSKPAFDIIGFDACLMSTLEVTHALDGFADFYCLSEETEPGDGWHYTPVLRAMSDDPTMSPAKVAQTIADSYTDFYMREGVNFPMIQWDVTFSVVEAKKAAELYDAYCALCQAQLLDAVSDPGVLAEIGRCSGRATRYAGSSHKVFNTVDLGNYMDYLGDSYPEECARVKKLVHEAVLYHRQNGALCDSTGMAVYVPSVINEIYGLYYFLEYIYNISDNDAITALYYYKQAGCLNEELKEAVARITDEEPQVLDVGAFKQFVSSKPDFDAEGFLLPISSQLQNLMTSYELETGRYDEKAGTITYYGREDCLTLDGEGHLLSDFDGKWICMDGQPLYVEITSSTPSATEYRAHVLYNGEDAYLELSRSRDTDEISITGVRKVPTGAMDDVNYMTNTRSNESVEYGAKITPVYQQTVFSSNSLETVNGKRISFGKNTRLRLEPLPAGYYLSTAVISDPRGDSYFSAVIGSTMKGGAMEDWRIDSRFYGTAHE